MVRNFHRIIGIEARAQILEQVGRLPDVVAACVGGGSNAIGIFHGFIDDPSVRLVGLEPGGKGIATGEHGATLSEGSPGLLHGSRSYLLQDDDGQITEAYSISAGLDYPGVGPEHAWLKETGRAQYRSVTDAEAMDALRLLSRTEGIIPAIESAHALAGALVLGRELGPDGVILSTCPAEATRTWTHREQVVRPGPAHGGRLMGRLDSLFARTHAENRAALIGYLPAGYPTLAQSPDLFRAMLDAGCDLVEIGVPFSDPVLDGPTIQSAADQALRGGFRLRDLFGVVESVASEGGHAVLMTYWNPVYHYRRRPLRPRPRRRWWARDHHAGPDSGRGIGVVGGVGGARPGPDLPAGTVVNGTAYCHDGRGDERLRVRGIGDGRDGSPGHGERGRWRVGRPDTRPY